MRRRQQFFFIGSVMIIAVLACQSNVAPVPSKDEHPTQPIGLLPTVDSLHAAETVFPTDATIADGEFVALKSKIFADANTACVFHTSSHNLSCLGWDGWRVYAVDAPTWIAQCPDGRIYLRKDDRLYLYANNIVSEIDNSPFMDGAGNLACGPGDEFWVSSGNSVSHFDGLAWTGYWATEYFGYAGYELRRQIAIAPNGDIWVTTNESIATFDGSNWQVFEEGKGLEEDPGPRGLAVDANGNVWVINVEGLLKYDGVHWIMFPAPDGFYGAFVTLDNENRIWIAGTGYSSPPNSARVAIIYTFDPQTEGWLLRSGGEVLDGTAVNAMQFDRRGRLWAATDYGLYIHDGSAWTAYHTYTSDLYTNTTDAIIVLGDGPQLPALTLKAPGSVRGKSVNPDSPVYEGMQVEICLRPVLTYQKRSPSPCADQAYHALTTMDADGGFLFTDIPVGKYYLMIQIDSSTWSKMVITSAYTSRLDREFEVYPGTETQLGKIMHLQESK